MTEQATRPTLQSRRAIEALRNGVPNSDAIEALGCSQPAVERAFTGMLDRTSTEGSSQGMLVSGDFGTGKSHLLGWLQERALESNFVCSRVVISKETPLFDLDKVFKAAVANAVVPGVGAGQMVEEVVLKLDYDSMPYVDFFQWANREDTGLHGIFPATLAVHQHLNKDPEVTNEINWFWSGEKISTPNVRKGLREAGQLQAYAPLRAPKVADLPLQRLRFLLELVKAVGYRGWVVLLDEIELVYNYSVLQRARSYAELARWMGQAVEESYPGLVVVGTLTTDFAEAALDGKDDRNRAAQRLRDRRRDREAVRAEAGMRFIDRTAQPLAQPDDDTLTELYRRLRTMHSHAYQWEAPEIDVSPSVQRSIRAFIRRWINEWDLRRLHPDQDPDIEETELSFSRDEDRDLETPVEGAQ